MIILLEASTTYVKYVGKYFKQIDVGTTICAK